MDGVVANLNERQSPIPSGGTEIKLKLYFRHTSMDLIEKLEGLVSRYKYDLGAWTPIVLMKLQAVMSQMEMTLRIKIVPSVSATAVLFLLLPILIN